MASGTYNRFRYNLAKKLLDWSTDTVKVILMNNSHSFTATNDVNTDVNTNELTTTGGYTVGGVTITTPTVTQATAVKLDGDDVSWTSATFTAYHAVLVDTTVSNNLIGSIDFGGAKTVSGGTFTIQWNAAGIITLS